MKISPAIRLQCSTAGYWIPLSVAMCNAELTSEELDDAIDTLQLRGQLDCAYDDYMDCYLLAAANPERFIAAKHPHLSPRTLTAATEYALRKHLLDADIWAELRALDEQNAQNKKPLD